MEYIPNQYTGQSIFQTPAYICKIPKVDLEKKREEFWRNLKRVSDWREPDIVACSADLNHLSRGR